MKPIITCLASLLLALGLATNAFALAGDLKEPGLAFPQTFPESARTTITAALTRPDCTFLGGFFLNSFTNLRYQGETPALNLFLEGLVKCPGVILTIRFQPENPTTPVNYDWLLAHTADQPHKLTIHINQKSPRIKLEKLVIPESQGPPLPKSEKTIYQSPFPSVTK